MPTMEDLTYPKYRQTSLVNPKKTMEPTNIDYFPVNTILMTADEEWLKVLYNSLKDLIQSFIVSVKGINQEEQYVLIGQNGGQVGEI